MVSALDGDRVRCPKCGRAHVLEMGKDYVTKKPVNDTLVYRCGNKEFIGAVSGALVEQIAKQKGTRIWRSLRAK